jgi:hypothetical protein
MTITAGTRLGAYEIVAMVGAGAQAELTATTFWRFG